MINSIKINYMQHKKNTNNKYKIKKIVFLSRVHLLIKGTGPSVFLLFSAKRLEKKLGHFLVQKD